MLTLVKDAAFLINRNSFNNDVLNLLNTAPCGGNFYNGPSENPGPNWGVSDRNDRPDRAWVNNINCGVGGEFSGLDYMLLHNLYYLNEGVNVFFSDYSNRSVFVSFPINNNFTLFNKNTVGAYEYLNSTSTVNSNAGVEFRAGKEISLSNGFSAIGGSDFNAIISPYQGTCGNDPMSKQNGESSNDDFFVGTGNTFASVKKDESNTLDVNLEENKSELEKELAELYKLDVKPIENFSIVNKVEFFS